MAFMIDTGSTGSGSQGPWVSWYANGSAKKRISPETWALREKDEGEDATHTEIDAFAKGVVLDLDTLKLGYTGDDGGPGRAPTKVWAPTLSLTHFPKPDDRKRATGGDFWQESISVRLAISKDRAATWEQAGFSAFEGFVRLSRLINAEWEANAGKCPVVVQTGVERIQSKKGNNPVVPILSVVKWVPKPDCLKGDAPSIDTGAPAPQPAVQPVQPAAPVTTTQGETITAGDW